MPCHQVAQVAGNGSGIPASIDTSGPSALAISRANSGLPAVAAMRQHRLGEAGPDWRSISTIRASPSSGPRDRAVVLSSPNARRNPSGSTSSAGRRTVVTKRCVDRRCAGRQNRAALADAESSQPASSTTASVGRRSASSVSTLNRAMPTARGSGSLPDGDSVRSIATSSASCWTTGSPAHLVDGLADQIGDSGERQPGLGLLTGAAQHAVAASRLQR